MSFNLNEIEMECENVQVVTNQATTSSTATQKPITQKIKRAEGAAIWREKNQMANRKEVKKEPNINVSYQDQSWYISIQGSFGAIKIQYGWWILKDTMEFIELFTTLQTKTI